MALLGLVEFVDIAIGFGFRNGPIADLAIGSDRSDMNCKCMYRLEVHCIDLHRLGDALICVCISTLAWQDLDWVVFDRLGLT